MNIEYFLETYNLYTKQFNFDVELKKIDELEFKMWSLKNKSFHLLFYQDENQLMSYTLNCKNQYGTMELNGEVENHNLLNILIYLFEFIQKIYQK
jgi:hypothetical protein